MPFNRYIHELEYLEIKKQNIYTIVIVVLVMLTAIKKCIYEQYNFILIFFLFMHMFTIIYSLPIQKKNLRIYIVGLTIFTVSYVLTYNRLGSVNLFFIGIEITFGAIYSITKNKIVLFSAVIVLLFSFLSYLNIGQYIDEENSLICFLIHLIYSVIAFVLIFTKITFMHKKYKLTLSYKKVWDESEINAALTDDISPPKLDELVQYAYKNHAGFTLRFKELFPVFTQKIETINPSIVTAEFEVIALLRLNFSTKEIARVTGSTVRAIESKKYRIRKKLNMPSDVDMSMFLSRF